jgi:argininosuccinate synthase
MAKKIKKIVLAYSGGLDTSVILPWLKEKYDAEVIAYVADVGQGLGELNGIREKALATGACEVVIDDLRKEFVEQYCYKMLQSGAIYEKNYLLGTSIARPIIAKGQVDCARKFKADAVAHGATGKGNDQVRFELTFMALGPKLEIIAPWKDPSFELTSREAAIEYAKERKIPIPVSKKKIYSRDRNLWHISHEGADLEDPANEPKKNLWMMSCALDKAPAKGTYVQIDFIKGKPVAIDGVKLPGHILLEKLNAIGGKHAIGQDDLVENRLVGIKSRGVYETPGGTILYRAHQALETITLDKDTLHYKQQIAHEYAQLVYDGKWFCPLRNSLDAFITATQKNVTGSVRIKCFKGHALLASVESPKTLYSTELASFTMGQEYTPEDAKGFIRLFGLQMKGRGKA